MMFDWNAIRYQILHQSPNTNILTVDLDCGRVEQPAQR
jgi:hypothetical protein